MLLSKALSPKLHPIFFKEQTGYSRVSHLLLSHRYYIAICSWSDLFKKGSSRTVRQWKPSPTHVRWTQWNQDEVLADSIHVETDHISCYLFINSSLNSASLLGVCIHVCVWKRHCRSGSMHRNACITGHEGIRLWRLRVPIYLCVCASALHHWFLFQPWSRSRAR